jgi:hypothetical protein
VDTSQRFLVYPEGLENKSVVLKYRLANEPVVLGEYSPTTLAFLQEACTICK